MTKYESDIKFIPADAEAIFSKLSNLENLQPLVDKIEDERLKEVHFTTDSCSLSVDPVGEVSVKLIEKDPFKTLKFASENSPVEFNIWIQLVQKKEEGTKFKIVIKADVPFMLKMMVSPHIKKGLAVVADALTKISYV